jgi:multidrug efflux pump subunit AcrB
MNKKYLLFNNPITPLIIICAIVILVIGIDFLAQRWSGNDFAVSFFIGCVSLILVNAIMAAENRSRKENVVEETEEES